jgi:hypothetical protein
MGTHDQLLHDMRLIWEGKPEEVSNTWKNNRSPAMSFAKIGGSGSRNIPWMANAIGCFFEDLDSARWVLDACNRELTYVDTSTHRYRFSCWELNSLCYESWNWTAEMSAMTWVRDWIETGCLGQAIEVLNPANSWCTRMLAHRAIMWAVQSRPAINAYRENGKLYWRGMGAYPGGLRSHPMSIYQGNQCGVDAVGLEPEVDKINQEEDLPRIISLASDWGLGSSLSGLCQRLAHGDLGPAVQAGTFPYLKATRTGIPWEVRRWGNQILSCATSHIQGGNTGAVWGTLVTSDEGRVHAYPYSSDRIRSGHPELGRGEVQWRAQGMGTGNPSYESYRAFNLTNEEAEQPNKGPRIEDGFTVPAAEPDLRLIFNPDQDTDIYVRGERWTP